MKTKSSIARVEHIATTLEDGTYRQVSKELLVDAYGDLKNASAEIEALGCYLPFVTGPNGLFGIVKIASHRAA